MNFTSLLSRHNSISRLPMLKFVGFIVVPLSLFDDLSVFWWYPLWFLRPRGWIFTLHVAVLIHLCVFRLLFLFYLYKKEYNLTLNRYFPGLDFTCWFLLFHLFARDVNKLRYFIIIIIIIVRSNTSVILLGAALIWICGILLS